MAHTWTVEISETVKRYTRVHAHGPGEALEIVTKQIDSLGVQKVFPDIVVEPGPMRATYLGDDDE